jgi:uncharacterized protein YndB with AHSA1/START domain
MKNITVETIVKSSLENVWEKWTKPEHIQNWNFASPDWCCPKVENNLEVGGKFSAIMSAKDGSSSFDFNGIYTKVEPLKEISYTIEGGRTVSINFSQTPEGVKVVETFEMENENSEELQRQGWQAILNNFKHYVEN